MTIDWWSLALQAINFLVLVWLLWRFLYRPVREVVEKRKALAEQAFVEADRKKEEAEAARQRFEDGKAQLAEERQDMLRKVHDELEAERAKVLDAARDEAKKMIDSADASIADERASALGEIRAQLGELAADLASGLLKKIGPNVLSEVSLEQLEKQLKELPTEELRRLKADFAANGARLAVVTAEPMASKDRERWTARLEAALGYEVTTEFAADPDILGGAEIHFPHAVLRFTWADQLQNAKNMMRRDETVT